MFQVVRPMLLLALVAALLIAPAVAQEKGKKKKKRGGAGNTPLAAVLQKAKTSDLSEETLAKIKDLVEKHQPAYMEARKKVAAVLSADVRKARNEARKKAQDEGKKGKELQAAVAAAVKLTDEQKKEVDAAQKEMESITQEFRKAVAALVTPEQAQKLGVAARGGKGKAKGKKANKAKANS